MLLLKKNSIKPVIGAGFVFLLSACVAQKDIILPSKTQRESRVGAYKLCVAQQTNRKYNDYENPAQIVRLSMDACKGAKYQMLKDYPKSWGESFEKRIDEEVYKQEITWVLKTRKSGKNQRN